ncbi:hypothetical protein PsW74_03573 [Pseudovibrio sp. W74]|nr:hypothetical protein PsW74_03573 [Pseudovibrio sp. W74]
MNDLFDGQIKLLMKQLKACQRTSNQTRTVVATPAGDNSLFLRPT